MQSRRDRSAESRRTKGVQQKRQGKKASFQKWHELREIGVKTLARMCNILQQERTKEWKLPMAEVETWSKGSSFPLRKSGKMCSLTIYQKLSNCQIILPVIKCFRKSFLPSNDNSLEKNE